MPELEKAIDTHVSLITAVSRPVGVVTGWGSGRHFYLQHASDYQFFSVHPDTGVVTFNAPEQPGQDYDADDIYECTIQVEYGDHIEYKQVRVENDRRKPLVSYPYGFSQSFGLLPIKPIRKSIPRYKRLWTH